MAKSILTGNPELIREINTQSLIQTIIEHEPISRAALAQKLNLTKATVSSIVQSLLDRGLLLEIGSEETDTKKGRKGILLKMNRACGHIISIDLSYDIISIMTSDLFGGSCSTIQILPPPTEQGLIQTLKEHIVQLKAGLPASRYGLIGIAIGIHGVVHHNKIIFLPYASYPELDLVTPLKEEFQVPVILENEANLSVLGEWAHCHHTNEMLYVSIHSGIGVGIIMRDQLVKGKNGYAGEFGHTIIEVNGKPCPCGNHGCLEQYASERAIFAEISWRKHRTISADEFELLYREKDPDALELMDQFILYISVAINNLLNTFNPDIIVLNSVLIRCKPDLCQIIMDNLQNTMKRYCTLIPSVLQDTSTLLGGAYMVRKEFLSHTSYFNVNGVLMK